MKVTTLGRYAFAAILCGVAPAVALPLDAPTSCFFLAIMASSLWANRGPGFLSVGLAAFAYDYFFLPPRFQLSMELSSFLRFAPFLGAALLVTGVIEVKRRVEESRRSERIQAESVLRKSESRLAEAQKLSHTGSWAWDAQRQETNYWSSEMFRIYGRDPSKGLPSTRELSALHVPQDWTNLVESAKRSVGELLDIDDTVEVVFANGSSKHIRIVGHPVVDAAGEVCELFGTAIDITEQHET